ncbi:MAG TPA: hypothetical protein VFG69_18175, partial [Nannocystaceae bacterium]|nr:hypothetical protein [Nannocystaceae bacterium]
MSVHRSVDDGAAVAALADVPRARGIVLAVVGRGSAPGLVPQPATVRAFATAARMRSVPQRWCAFGRPADPAIVAALADERVPTLEDRDPRTLVCRWPGIARTVTIPRGWIGRHLCLVVPCVGVSAPRRGPVAAALAAIADAVGAGDGEMPCEIGAHVVAGTFAGVTIVVDAHVAIVRARPGAARLVPAQRVFTAHRVPAPASWLLALAPAF